MLEEAHVGGLKFPDLSIQGFRGIRDLSIPHLGRVTLITGKNNTGKSSILEALRLHTSNAAFDVVYDVLEFREEQSIMESADTRFPHPGSLFEFSSLFHGFPTFSETSDPIVISTSGKTRPMRLNIRMEWLAEEEDSEGNTRLVPHRNDRFEEYGDTLPFLVVETEDGTQNRRLRRLPARHPRLGRRFAGRERTSCVLVNPYGGEKTYNLDSMWGKTALTDNEKHVIEALRIIDPKISAVSMVASEVDVRTAIVRSRDIPRPVPLRSFGDGMTRLFAIVLSLVNAQGGLLLIDEFENGLHYSVQLDIWRMIFRLAQILDVQVFATSHSRDTVEAFQTAASESPGEDALVRLTRRGDDVISTVFSERELEIATRDEIEVR